MAEKKNELTSDELNDVSGGWTTEEFYNRYKKNFDSIGKGVEDEKQFLTVIINTFGWNTYDQVRMLKEIYRTHYAH